MNDILERLRGYNPPDRTIDEQRQIAIDIQDAIKEIEDSRELLKLIHSDLKMRAVENVVDISDFIWQRLKRTIKQDGN